MSDVHNIGKGNSAGGQGTRGQGGQSTCKEIHIRYGCNLTAVGGVSRAFEGDFVGAGHGDRSRDHVGQIDLRGRVDTEGTEGTIDRLAEVPLQIDVAGSTGIKNDIVRLGDRAIALAVEGTRNGDIGTGSRSGGVDGEMGRGHNISSEGYCCAIRHMLTVCRRRAGEGLCSTGPDIFNRDRRSGRRQGAYGELDADIVGHAY